MDIAISDRLLGRGVWCDGGTEGVIRGVMSWRGSGFLFLIEIGGGRLVEKPSAEITLKTDAVQKG